MKKKLLIIGAGGHGKVVADIAIKMKKWESVVFLDDNKDIQKSMGLDVIGTSNEVMKLIDHYEVFVGIGDNKIRQRIHSMLEDAGASIPVLIHPKSIIAEQVDINFGTVVMAGVVINSCTKIGKGCILNTASTVDHDNILEDFTHLSPGVHLGGTVKVGHTSWLGMGSVVINGINIIGNCKIGAGAVVLNDITKAGTYVGIPARRLTDGKDINFG